MKKIFFNEIKERKEELKKQLDGLKGTELGSYEHGLRVGLQLGLNALELVDSLAKSELKELHIYTDAKKVLEAYNKVVGERITFQDLKTQSRKQRYVMARRFVYYFLNKYYKHKLTSIAQLFKKNHAGVLHNIETLENDMFLYEREKTIYHQMKKRLKK